MFTIPIGPTGDEGWFRGQCRFSKLAPAWGEFYEIQGDLLLDKLDDEWIEVPSSNASEDTTTCSTLEMKPLNVMQLVSANAMSLKERMDKSLHVDDSSLY